MNQHGNNSVAGVIRNRLISFHALKIVYYHIYQICMKKVYSIEQLTVIEVTHLPIYNVCVRAHPLVSRLMKGIFKLRPAVPKYLKTWDVSVVLKYLISLSPAPLLSLKRLTLKLVMIKDL